jgi:GABA(A) receptor-associated protein
MLSSAILTHSILSHSAIPLEYAIKKIVDYQDDRPTFQKNTSLESRKLTFQRLSKLYPDRIPVVIEKMRGILRYDNIPNIDKTKFLLPKGTTIGNLILELKNHMSLYSYQAIFVYVSSKDKDGKIINDILPPTAAMMDDIYERYKSDDGFLYISYAGENTFG